MHYTYTLWNSTRRVDICTKFEEAEEMFNQMLHLPVRLEVFDNTTMEPVTNILTEEALGLWRDKLERDAAWKPVAINHTPPSEKPKDPRLLKTAYDWPSSARDPVDYYLNAVEAYKSNGRNFPPMLDISTAVLIRERQNEVRDLLASDPGLSTEAIKLLHAYLSRLDSLQVYPKTGWKPSWVKEAQETTGGVEPESIPKGEEKSIQEKVVEASQRPKHYQNYFQHHQWLEVMQDVVWDIDSALDLQIRKYLDRLGEKDLALQELLKAKFYLDFRIARRIKGEFIQIKDVQSVISEYINKGS